MIQVYYRCQENGRVDVLFAYKRVTPSSYVWCVKGISGYGSTIPTWGFGLLRIDGAGGNSELYGFEEIDYVNTCSSEVYKYSCNGLAIDQIEVQEEEEPEELDELSVSAEEMRGLSGCESLLDNYYYTAEEDQDPDCGYFIDEEKQKQHGDSFWTESFDAWVYQAAKHVNQAGTHMELLPD